MPTAVPIAPGMLQWAVERSGRGDADFERKFPAWHEWIDGVKMPTIKQVESVAQYSHVPFGVFFLREPPLVQLPIPDFRRGADGRAKAPSQELLEVLESSLLRQAWYRDWAIANEVGPAGVTHLDLSVNVRVAAQAVTHDLGFSVEQRRRIGREEARNHLRHQFENLGGIAVFTSMVGNDNHRPLSRAEFRGFTLADPVVPLIFVNTADDTLAGQIFTTLHEYGHVALGESALGDEDEIVDAGDPGHAGRVERWCDAVAAEVLVPSADLEAEFRQDGALTEELDRLARRYHASTLTVLIRLRDVGLVARHDFEALYSAEQRRIDEVLRKRPKDDGGNHYLNQPFRLGESFSRAVIRETRRGALSYTDAFRLLNLRNAKQFEKYAQSLGMS